MLGNLRRALAKFLELTFDVLSLVEKVNCISNPLKVKCSEVMAVQRGNCGGQSSSLLCLMNAHIALAAYVLKFF